MSTTTKWVKMANPGQFRGEGTWVQIKNVGMTEAEWLEVKNTNYLPVHEGDEPPKS